MEGQLGQPQPRASGTSFPMEGPDIEDMCSDQEEQVDEAFYRQLKVASRSLALVLTADFNHTNNCWRENTALEVPGEH